MTKGQKFGSLNPRWKGDDVGYRGLHYWVERQLGKAKSCSNCNNKEYKRYHWANVSGLYKRDKSDWINLCPFCHERFDIMGELPTWD